MNSLDEKTKERLFYLLVATIIALSWIFHIPDYLDAWK
tara:strand:+ start:1697 stop:1810 length:114 start_codon:yes stop_codon:yes gene_type:complete